MSIPKRIGIIVLGLLVGLIGLMAWGLEQEYGGGNNAGSMEIDGDVFTVYEVNEQIQDSEGHPMQVEVFSGTEEEAYAYVDSREQNKNFVVPGLIIAAGAGLMLLALIPSRRKGEEDTTEAEAEHR